MSRAERQILGDAGCAHMRRRHLGDAGLAADEIGRLLDYLRGVLARQRSRDLAGEGRCLAEHRRYDLFDRSACLVADLGGCRACQAFEERVPTALGSRFVEIFAFELGLTSMHVMDDPLARLAYEGPFSSLQQLAELPGEAGRLERVTISETDPF